MEGDRIKAPRRAGVLVGVTAVLMLAAAPGAMAHHTLTDRAGLAGLSDLAQAGDRWEVEDVAPSQNADATDAPEATERPEATDAPEVTDAPEATERPEATDAPEATERPEATDGSESHDGGGGTGDH